MPKERSYAKESYKTSPVGIRFNIEHERIAMMRSKKKTRQQLVDFLLENYVKGENPVLDRQTFQTAAPIVPYVPPAEIKLTPTQWVQEKREIADGDTEAYMAFIKRLDAAQYLTAKDRQQIKFA